VTIIIRREVSLKREDIPSDFNFPQLRTYIREQLLKMSNKMFEKFAAVNTPPEYDRQVLKKI
jgi:hypothetical protein